MEIKVELSNPINEGKIAELVVKEPTFKVLRRCGLPFTAGEIDFDKAAPMLEACTGVPAPFLDGLTGKDAMAAIAALSQVLGGDEEAVKN